MDSHTHSAYDIDDVAREYHRHYEQEDLIAGLRHDLNQAFDRIAELEIALAAAQAARR